MATNAVIHFAVRSKGSAMTMKERLPELRREYTAMDTMKFLLMVLRRIEFLHAISAE